MTDKLSEERWWQALDDLAGADIAPLEITDRRILKAAAQAAPRQQPRRWIPVAIAASLAIGGITLSLIPRSGPEQGVGEVMPANAGKQDAAPAQPAPQVEIIFAPGSAVLTPRAQADLGMLSSQTDLCAAGTRIALRVGGDAPRRAAAIGDALARIAGGRCHPGLQTSAPAAGQDGDRAMLEVLPASR